MNGTVGKNMATEFLLLKLEIQFIKGLGGMTGSTDLAFLYTQMGVG